jgi:hypothetical protein
MSRNGGTGWRLDFDKKNLLEISKKLAVGLSRRYPSRDYRSAIAAVINRASA